MTLMIPRMKYAFFGMSLSHGSRVVAYIYITIYSILAFAYLMQSEYKRDEMKLTAYDDWPQNNSSTEPDYDETYDELSTSSGSISTFFLEITTVIQLVSGVMLLYGVKLSLSRYTFSWVLLQSGMVLHSQIAVVIHTITVYHERQVFNLFGFICHELFSAAISFYCMSVVYNHTVEIETLENEARETT